MGTLHTTKTALAKKLGISRSSLYYQAKKPPQDEESKLHILAVMSEHPAYGHRRVALALSLNHKKINRLMHKFKLKPRVRRGVRPVKLGDQSKPETLIKNVLLVLCPVQPNIVWAGDFTYFWFQDRFWYLATVIDVYTREILGWHVANHHTTSLIIEAFSDAVRRTHSPPQYFHSDQGSEYISGGYASLLQSHKTTPSHSRKSSPWQNGFQESFYSNFKLELGEIKNLKHVGELIEAIHQQIVYYNDRRIHTKLKMPPTLFRQLKVQKQLVLSAAQLSK